MNLNRLGARMGLAKRKKEKRQQLEKGEGMGGKPSLFPLFNTRSRTVGRILADGTRPAQRNIAWLMGHGLGRAHHYRNLGAVNKAQRHANDPPLS